MEKRMKCGQPRYVASVHVSGGKNTVRAVSMGVSRLAGESGITVYRRGLDCGHFSRRRREEPEELLALFGTVYFAHEAKKAKEN